ncbi:cytochrome c biogenesis protein CcsA [Verrucomicrobiales bacterium]|nr:cytochrome c biogenesis protein CcsA [Verrucomicrobiales bacterium]
MKTLILSLVSLLAFAVSSQAKKPEPRWSKEIVSVMETLPIQEGGRIKPLDTHARFTMLALHGKRGMKLADGTKLTPTEWLLDCLFYPEIAKTYPTFIVDNADTITALGLERHEKRRDRYTYEELLPGRDKLQELSLEARKVEDTNDRSLFQRQIIQLHGQVNTFEYLVNSMSFARVRYPYPEGDETARKAFLQMLGGEPISVSEVVSNPSRIYDFLENSIGTEEGKRAIIALQNSIEEGAPQQLQSILRALIQANGNESVITMIFRLVAHDAQVAEPLHFFPPEDAELEEWESPGTAITEALGKPVIDHTRMAERVAMLEKLAAYRDDPKEFLTAATALRDLTTSEAKDRGELGQVSTEVAYYRAKPLFYGLWLSFLAVIIYGLSFLRPDSKFGKISSKVALVLTLIALVSVLTAIGMRMRIRGLEAGMGPVTNLYETIIFISAFMSVIALVVAKVFKSRLCCTVAAAVITVGMFVSVLFEASDASDTINSLPPVLITNFWLLTHVPTINLGYAGCMLAAFFSWIYAIARLFDLRGNIKERREFYKILTTITYIILCFGMVTALVGTVLGGIWANYSWGRFWGWDPKENGALMIVLWSLAILHARMGGYIKQIGFHLCSIFGGIIVAFSWFHTNLLGIGLHSYGFSGGLKRGVLIFYAISAFMFLLALLPKFFSSKPQKT